jgi:hypothetical protein
MSMDIYNNVYFFSSILNIIFDIFGILFILYKFTSFFSYIYNFILFLGKMMKGVFWITDQIKLFFTKKNGYTNGYTNDSINIREADNQTIFQRMRNWYSNEPKYISLPLNEFQYVSRENILDSDNCVSNSHVSINMEPYASSWASTQLHVPDSIPDGGLNNMSSSPQPSRHCYPPPPLPGADLQIKENSSSDFFRSSFIKKWMG